MGTIRDLLSLHNCYQISQIVKHPSARLLLLRGRAGNNVEGRKEMTFPLLRCLQRPRGVAPRHARECCPQRPGRLRHAPCTRYLASCFVPFCSREPCTRTVLQNDQEYKKFRKFGNIVDSTAKSIIKISVLGIVNSRPISRLFNPPYCRPQRP